MLFFTVCHINQLAEALVLGDSLQSQSAADNINQLYIGLIDDKKNIPDFINLTHPVVGIEELQLANFSEMCQKFTTDELLRNSKPFFAEYFLNRFQEEQNIGYFDATSLIFNKLDFIEQRLQTNNIVITPQLIHANKHPNEKQVLNSGIFHAGFFALKRSDESFKFLHWWQARVAEKGFIDMCKGLNAEQLWLEHVPAMYDGVYIEKNDGLNVGKWNLSERKVEEIGGGNHWMSNQSPLISYNFRGITYWKLYQQQLQKYQPHKLKVIKPTFGLFIKPKRSNFFTKSLRNMAQNIDKLIDWIG